MISTGESSHRGVLERIRDYAAAQNLRQLVHHGASREELLNRLAILFLYSGSSATMELHRLPSKRAKSQAQTIRQTANLVASLNRRLDNGSLLEIIQVRRNAPLPNDLSAFATSWNIAFSYREILCWPQALREYADRVEALPKTVKIRWKPVQTAAIAQIVWYVKQSTRRDCDVDLAPLIGAVGFDRSWTAANMKKWRTRHRLEIRKLGPLSVLPVLPRPPR